MHRKIRHIEFRQHFLGCFGVVVGRPADEREAGERHHRVNQRTTFFHEERVNRRPSIEAGRERGDHLQPASLHCGNHAVVMIGVARQHVRAHQQQAHRAALAARRDGRQGGYGFRHARCHVWVVETHFRILNRFAHFGQSAKPFARAIGVAIHQCVNKISNVLLGSSQPILHGQKIGTHILRSARNETQQARQTAQHLHLLRTFGRARGLLRAFFFVAFESLEHRHDAGGGLVHLELADACELHHLCGGHAAHHRITVVASSGKYRQDRLKMILHKEH